MTRSIQGLALLFMSLYILILCTACGEKIDPAELELQSVDPSGEVQSAPDIYATVTEVKPGAQITVTVLGGEAPLRYEVSPSTLGSISTSTLTFTGGQEGTGVIRVIDAFGRTDEVSVTVKTSTATTTPAIDSAVSQACVYEGTTNIPGPTSGTSGQIEGWVDGIIVSNNRAILFGWACVVGSNHATDIQIYVDGPAGLGGSYRLSATTAALADTPIQNICRTNSAVRLRYYVDVTDLMATDGGRSIYVHGINPYDNLNYYLRGSARCRVPKI